MTIQATMKCFSVILAAILTVQCQAGGVIEAAPGTNMLETRYEEIQPAAFVTIGGREYYFSPLPETLEDSFRYCTDIGFRLVSLETAEKNTLIANYLQSIQSSRSHWTSAFKVLDRWMWTGRGQFFSFTNWGGGEPNYPGPEAAGVVVTANGLWFDYSKAAAFYYICEKDADC